MLARQMIFVAATLVLSGCDKFVARNTATIQIDGLWAKPAFPILIDPSLKPEVDEFHRDGKDWFFGIDRKQQVVIRNSGPLKLVPATPEEIATAMDADR